jgi:O-antigen/teichoic acid export membrane protein
VSKTKKSFYNILASLLEVIVTQVITLVVSRKVLSVYGSDINGVNAVFTNTLVWLMLIEGGFTFASSVALFKAFAKKDLDDVNKILSATKSVLNKIGLYVGLGGIALAIVAPFFIKTKLSYEVMLYMFLLMAFGAFFGLSYTRKYALMFSVKQEEYFKIYISIIISVVINAIIYFVATKEIDYIWVRIIFAIGVVLTGILTYYIVKKRYPFISYNEEPDFTAIKGTKDMVFNKFASLVNSSIPLIYIASVVGASFASVYAVYMIVFGFITKLSMMVANAVQNGFGQMIAEKTPSEVYQKFKVFEYILIFMAFLLISISTPLTMPFIKFYTKNVHDVNYVNWDYLYLFTGISLVRIIHNPSGITMLMSGAFKTSKKIQINALIILILGMIVGGYFWEVTGILAAILLSAIVLAVQEIVYTRRHYFKIGFRNLYKILFVFVITTSAIIYVELFFISLQLTFFEILFFAAVLAIINFSIFVIVTFVFFNEFYKEFLVLIKSLISINNKNNIKI